MPHASSSTGLFGAGVVLLSWTPVAWALGMGNVHNSTVLGAPLNVSIPVFGAADEKMPPTADCIKAEVMAGESRIPPKLVRTSVEPARGEGLYRVRVTTEARIGEPVVTVSLGLGCDSPLTKQFVLFVDPPGLPTGPAPVVLPGDAASTASGGAVPSSVRSAQASSSTPLRPSQAGAPAGRQRARPAASASGEPAQPAPRTVARAGANRGAGKPAAAKPPSGPRLTLEAPTEPVISPVLPAPAASEPSAEDVALAKQLALLTELEGVLKQVSAENKSVQESMAGLQLKLRNAELALQQERERQRAQPPVVWVLAGVVGLLTLTLLVVLWRQRRRPPVPFYQRSSVFGDAQQGLPEPPVLDSMPSHLQPLEPVVAGEAHASAFLQAEPEPAVTPAAAPVAVAAVAAGPVQAAPPASPASPSPREVAVEELIDLEQQADFFIALGQDQEAIELLTSHMNGASSGSPLPYLKLIDIYRRLGDRMAYEQTRLRFHRRFTARIPDWNAPQGAERGLEEYGEIMRVLEACWAVPMEAMKRLESLLFRKDGQSKSNTFDLTAYRDLLMLYAVARDLQAQGMQGVDLEL